MSLLALNFLAPILCPLFYDTFLVPLIFFLLFPCLLLSLLLFHLVFFCLILLRFIFLILSFSFALPTVSPPTLFCLTPLILFASLSLPYPPLFYFLISLTFLALSPLFYLPYPLTFFALSSLVLFALSPSLSLPYPLLFYLLYLPHYLYLILPFFICLISLSLLYLGLMGWVARENSIPGRVIPKTEKMVLDATLLNTQHYKVQIKGKMEQSREWSSTHPYTSE